MSLDGPLPSLPGITELEAVARGQWSASALAGDLRQCLVAGDARLVLAGCERLWMAAAYHQRATFERTAFHEVPEFQVAARFALPMVYTAADLRRATGVLRTVSTSGAPDSDRARRALQALDHVAAVLAWPQDALGHATWDADVPQPAAPWYPGSNYSEAPMLADGVRSFADERVLLRQLEARIRQTVARVAAVTGCPVAHGNHAKATVLSARMDLDHRARPEWQGLFGSAPLRGGLRFSNSAPDLRTGDHTGNLFGFRFSFQLDIAREPFTTPNADGGWMTLTANSAPRPHVSTPERHVIFTDSVGSPHHTRTDILRSACAGSRTSADVIRDTWRLAREVVTAIPQGRAVSAHPRLHELEFHSRHAYRLGAQAVRYVVRLIEPEFPVAPRSWTEDLDYRHRMLLHVVAQHDLKLSLAIQVLPDYTGAHASARALSMIENMRADWTAVPDEPFATITVPRQQTTATAERARMVQWFADNPVDLVAAGGWFAPLGAAGRARTSVYAASQEARAPTGARGLPPRLRDRDADVAPGSSAAD